MKEIIKQMYGFNADLAISNLGYIINITTRRCLIPSPTTNQIALSTYEGQKFFQMRKLVAEHFDLPVGKTGNVWHLDNNVYNNAEDNLWAVDKQSHLSKGFRAMQRLLQSEEKTFEEIGEMTGLGAEFVNQCVLQKKHLGPVPYFYKPRDLWSQERVQLCFRHFVEGSQMAIELDLADDFIQRNEHNQPTIMNLEELQ